MKTIAFIGVGVMGKSMVQNLNKAGYPVTIYTRTQSKVQDLLDNGIQWANTVKECIENKDIIMTMVGYPSDVEDIYFGKDGILNNARPGSICIDFTTSSPKLAIKIYNEALKKGIESLDAPVSGGDVGAKNATLSIMVGGNKDTYNKVYPLFKTLGETINYVGNAGFGQHTKMANQIIIAGTLAGVVEAIHYGHQTGLDMETMMKCISQGAAGSWQLEHNGQAILNNNFQPGFYIKHFIKDMKIAQDEMNHHHTHLDVLDTVIKMYEKLNENESGTQALIHYYEEN